MAKPKKKTKPRAIARAKPPMVPLDDKPKKYHITWRCNGCNVVGEIYSDTMEDPEFCAKCQRKIGRLRIEAAAKSPRNNVIRPGGNFTKAMDMTADIVMKDFGMTDMKDDFRPGESCAPKLPPSQQARADAFFSAGRGQRRGQLPPNAAMMGKAAIKGAYARPTIDPIAAVHSAKHKIQVTEIFEKKK